MTPGETGTVTKLEHMPDQIPDNPATLAANTSIETLQNIMYSNWVWRNTFVIDSSMQPGHVFGLVKIHPKNCNDYITHISRMFLTWNGAFKIRTRFMATFQFGGSVRLGFLPPKFTEAQVQNMPIQTLTAYPNIDMDPKNIGWSEFQASDERNVLFHWMSELEDSDPQSFAGWFVFYIAAPIVVSGTVTAVSLLVEAAGAFEFAQLAPIGSIGPQTTGWLTNSTRFLNLQPGCEDGTVARNAIQVNPVSVKQLPVGFLLASAVGGALPTSLDTTNLWPDQAQAYRNLAFTADAFRATGARSEMPNTTTPEMVTFEGNTTCAFSVEGDTYGYSFDHDMDAPHNIKESKSVSIGFSQSPSSVIKVSGDPGYVSARVTWAIGQHVDATRRVQPIDFAKLYNTGDMYLKNLLPNESIVTFVSLDNRSISLQTKQMYEDLKAAPTPDPNTSQLYQLYTSTNPSPLLLLRLQPNGMFSTTPTDVVALLQAPPGGELYLRYLQSLPMNSPLPNAAQAELVLYNAARKTRRAVKMALSA